MLRKYKYRTTEGYEITLFGYCLCLQKFKKNVPWEILSGDVRSIYFNGYYIYLVKLWKSK